MENDVYKAPDATLVVNQSTMNELAGRWERLGAAIIDALLIVPVTIPLTYFTGGFEGIFEGIKPLWSYSLGIALVGIMVFVVINGHLLRTNGQTVGKKILGIKIVRLDHSNVRVEDLFKRYGVYLLVPRVPLAGQFISMINILFIFSPSKRCLHDRVGGTLVINAN